MKKNTFLSYIQNGVAILSAGLIGMKQRPIEDQGETHYRRTASHFYYLTNITESNTIAIYTTVHDKHQLVLFWDEATDNEKTWTGNRMTKEQIQECAQADIVYPLNEFPNKLTEYLEHATILYYTLYLDPKLDEIVLSQREKLLRKDSFSYHKQYPSQLHDLEEIIANMRLYKQPEEIKNIKKAIQITKKALEYTIARIQPGQYEFMIEAQLHYQYRYQGARGPAFPTIVATGSNATVLHYTNNTSLLKKNQLLLIDTGAEYNYYCADITRTIPISGKFTEPQQELYDLVLKMQQCAIAEIQPNRPIHSFHQAAIRVLSKFLSQKKILQQTPEEIIQKKLYFPFYPHGTGHWLGLDVHDAGKYFHKEKPISLQPGMVLTVEPGIYFSPRLPNIPKQYKGIGIRIEDNILVTETGNINLSKSIRK
ncbi:MAG TPA: aminopeptidase P family protein [Planctomycetota bacterium]|nr:aminopeptidase P family protein [Planctomycetota bacterium]HRU52025.1 aminopeptidase P family protein [Planctomycetota bacterium]